MFIPRTEGHRHSFNLPVKKPLVVAIRSVVKEDGKMIRHTMTARDTLLQHKCACGEVQTYDMVRTVIETP